MTSSELLIEVLVETKVWLSRSENDFVWSSWDSVDEALTEIEGHIARVKNGDGSRVYRLQLIFAPTGPMQEVAISSGWGDEFLSLASRFDATTKPNNRPNRRPGWRPAAADRNVSATL